MNTFSTSVIRRCYPRWCLENVVFRLVIQLGPRHSVLRVPGWIRDTWFFLVPHFNWPEFLENFLAFCSLQQFQVKSSMTTCELKWWSLWQAIAGVPSKIEPRCSPRVSTTIEWSLIIEVEEKSYCSSVFMGWWYGYRDYRSFSKQSPCRYWPKNLFILTSWDTGKKLMLNEGCWSTSSKLLPNYLWITCWEISK